jgi:hypothetical protein
MIAAQAKEPRVVGAVPEGGVAVLKTAVFVAVPPMATLTAPLTPWTLTVKGVCAVVCARAGVLAATPVSTTE